MNQGTIVQCIGAVIDVEFARDAAAEHLRCVDARRQRPDARSAATAGRRRRAHHLPRFGRRPAARDEGDEHRQPDLGAGRAGDARTHHGRAGPADRRAGAGRGREADADPPRRADVRGAVAVDRAAGDGHQGDRPRMPVRQGRQGGVVRRRRRGQDRDHARADQQHRHTARGLVGIRRRRRAHAGRQRLLSRDARRRRRQVWTT